MGFVVLHINKAVGNDAAMTAHIERTVDPKNIDKSRTHLNRELMEFPEGVSNRTQAIQHRLDHAGLQRKIGTNQVRAIRLMLSGSPDDMQRIQDAGRLDEWCNDNLNWLRKTYGADNLVSATLHMDETSPHIHATVVPIVTGERRKAKDVKTEPGKKKYRKKDTNTARLCADDVMTRDKLKEYQDTYALAMHKYGLQRGVEGSKAKHITNTQFYRELYLKQDSIKKNIQEDIEKLQQQGDATRQEIHELGQQKEDAQQRYTVIDTQVKERKTELNEARKELKQVKGQIVTGKLKGSLVNTVTNVTDKVGSMFNDTKAKKFQEEIQALQSQNETLHSDIRNLQEDLRNMQDGYENRIDQLRQEIKQMNDYFPDIKELLQVEKFCRAVNFGTEITKRLLNREPVTFNGELYSAEYKRYFKAQNSTATVERNPKQPGKFHLCVDGLDIIQWFRKKYREFQEDIGIKIKPETNKRQGVKM